MTRETPTEEQSWRVRLDDLAADAGATIVVQGKDNVPCSISNNNSICAHLYSSAEFAPLCAADCGRAFQTAHQAGETVEVKCHAGLHFLAKPFSVKERRLVAIIGRAFRKTEEYKAAAERATQGDWTQFPLAELFSNAHFTGAAPELQALAVKFDKKLKSFEKENREVDLEQNKIESNTNAGKSESASGKSEAVVTQAVAMEENTPKPTVAEQKSETSTVIKETAIAELQSSELKKRNEEEITRLESWRSVFASLSKLDYKSACASVLNFIGEKYQLTNTAWLERRHETLEIAQTGRDFTLEDLKLKISADDERLTQAFQNFASLDFREHSAASDEAARTIQIFPAAIGGQIRAALLCGEPIEDANSKRKLSKLARVVALELEFLRLGEAAKQKERLERALLKISENLRRASSQEVWEYLTQTFTEMLQSERSSLLVFDETNRKFTVQAAVGRHADVITNLQEELDSRVIHGVLQTGTPLLVEDIRLTEIPPASPRRKYRTRSFISYPLIIDNRKIGVFNVTDKADGGHFSQTDVQILNAFAPQLAITLDRTTLQKRAGRLEVLSITDPLTGLPNRRYLEERLTEEIKRFERDGSPLSFMMIDVDEFKSYNDKFTHPEGDKALKMVAQALREKLRGADVAARYGGEEFSILLPQTTPQDAATIAERIRERVEQTKFPNRRVTISVGIAHYTRDFASYDQLVSAADEALYEAKREGRNNVKIFQRSTKVVRQEQANRR